MFKTIKELGQGSFGLVTLVKSETDQYYACKEITDDIDILVGIRETDALMRVHGCHSHIVGIHGYQLSVDHGKYVIQQYLEYCSEGSLEELLDREFKNPDRGIVIAMGGIRQRLEQLTKIVGSLAFLQSRGIYHMDIKTENILYRRDGGMCLCDFSNYYLKTGWKEGMEAPLIPLESVMYRPPEIGFMKNSWENYEKTDVWAMGIILLETLGAWEFVQKVDARAVYRGQKIKELADKMRILQTNFMKRNGRRDFKTPFRIMFGETLGSACGDKDFGKKISDDCSPEHEMILTAFYAREYSDPTKLQEALEVSREYFTLRKAENDLELLDKVFQSVFPGLFQVNPEKRMTMIELYQTLCSCLGCDPSLPTEKMESGHQPDSTLGLWERIPDVVWRECFQDFFESCKGVTICYGKHSTYPIPLNSLVFAKHLAEDVLENLIMGGSDQEYFVPTDPSKRVTFYGFVLASCVLIASEFMDFIFPTQDCPWFEDKPLEDVAPYLKLTGDLLMGKIGETGPTKAERELMLGITGVH